MKSWAIAIITAVLYFIVAGAARHLPASDALWPIYSGDVMGMVAYMIAFVGGAATVATSR